MLALLLPVRRPELRQFHSVIWDCTLRNCVSAGFLSYAGRRLQEECAAMMPRAIRLLISLCVIFASGALPADEHPSSMRDYLQQRLLTHPDDAASHRLLGRLLLEEGDTDEAIRELEVAVKLDPLSCAARFDLARALFLAGDEEAAVEEWKSVLEIAPESEYAAEAEQKLSEAKESSDAVMKTVGYEVHEFPGPPGVEPIHELPATPTRSVPVFLKLETGLLYNSNVALAPSSRQLPAGERASFQLFASSELEWWAVSRGNWSAGPLFSGYFTVNEESFQNFNLNSYSPGLFLERADVDDDSAPVLRLEYRFGLDEFGGQKFSQRHSVIGRVTKFQVDGATAGYVAIDQTSFVDDGVLPEVTSADGTAYATGASRSFDLDSPWMRQLRLGIDFDRLDTHGSDYAYWGTGVSLQTITVVTPTVDLTIRTGAGYRVFDRYQFEPDRDEMIWRGGAEVRKWFRPRLSMAAVVNYQVFDSNNPLFASDRLLTGLTLEYRY